MHAHGLIDAEPVELPNRAVSKKIYSLTPSGAARLQSFLLEPLPPPSFKDELLLRLYCADRIPSDVLERHLDAHVHELITEELSLSRRIAQHRTSSIGVLLSVELALERIRERIAACKRTVLTLRDAASQEPPRS